MMKSWFSIFLCVNIISVVSQNNDSTKVYAYSIEEALQNPEKVYSLYISDLDTFPEKLLLFTNLEKLTIDYCNFQFPKSIEKLSKLNLINISHCEIFPIGIENIPSLNELTFSSNSFKIIPKEVAKKLELKKITINDLYRTGIIPNGLSIINVDSIQLSFLQTLKVLDEIKLNKSLKSLKLYQCQLDSFPSSFNENVSLETLFIDGGKFINGNKCAFISNLKKINSVTIKGINFSTECLNEIKKYKNIHL